MFTRIAFVGCVVALSACTIAPPPVASKLVPKLVPNMAATATRAPTAVPTPTATMPPPTATPNSQVLHARAEQARHNGDTATAAREYGAASLQLDGDAGREARFELARAQYEAGALPQAAFGLTTLISETAAVSPTHTSLGVYYALLGRAMEAAGNPPAAALGYAAAISAGSVISPYLYLWLGNYQLALNQPISAAMSYRASVDAAPSAATEFARRENLAQALLQAKQPAAAAAEYDVILTRARNAGYRAQILWDAAQALQSAGDLLTARSRMYKILVEHERTSQALLAMQVLLADGQPVDELQRGRVYFFNGDYASARDAFRRAIALGDGRADEVRMWAARNYVALGLPADALRNLDQVLADNLISSTVGASAAAFVVELQVNSDAAAARALAERLTLAGASADDLRRTATALAGAGFTDDALRIYGVAQDDGAAAALLLQAKRPAEAEPLLERALRSASVEDAPRLRLTLSRAQIAAGRVVSGENGLRALAVEFADSYEGVRASRIVSPSGSSAAFVLPDADAGREEAEAWLRAWLGLDVQVRLGELPAVLTSDVRFIRGSELLRLGFEPEALDEYAALLDAHGDNPRMLYALALHFRDVRLYRLSIRAADALMRLSPARTPSQLPKFLARLLYPVYFADLVTDAAREFDLPPALIFSVMRQESLFEPFAASSAAASGLMQIMPATGVEIQQQLNWPLEYSQRDLARPFVSVRFGAYYLSKQMRLFDGVVHIVLAAYNGGPGNALRWRERGGDGPDEFLDAVTYEETQRYITSITVNQAQYARLYAK
ncbi:MAG: transglycosylase SLT domain-containing protein [Chloroflexi bacterium]|nr:transglycosylase SLT domain-containing protein [Chloroflexota bacterium]